MDIRNFDHEFYLKTYNDLPKAGILTREAAFDHWIKFGKNEGRVCNIETMKTNYTKNRSIIEDEYRKLVVSKHFLIQSRINILIRTTRSREKYFKKCINSILTQNYTNYKIYVSYDYPECLNYLNEYSTSNDNKVEVYYVDTSTESSEKYRFNLYCNILMDKVSSGFIVFLDDDDAFTHTEALNSINISLNNNPNSLVIWKFLRPDRVVFPTNINSIKLGEIASCGFCFHSQYKNYARWVDKQCGDYVFFSELIKNNKFDMKFNDFILTQTSFDDRVGNYGCNNNNDNQFDWKFYVKIYPDLQKAGINTEEKALEHYTKYGKNEKRRVCRIIKDQKLLLLSVDPEPFFKMCQYCHNDQIIRQAYVSEGLNFVKRRFLNKYSLDDCLLLERGININLPIVLFGVYTDQDLLVLNKHKGVKIIIWGGEDANPNNLHSKHTLEEIKSLNNTIHLSISECILTRLLSVGIASTLIDFNLVDVNLFYRVPKNSLGSKIFIYNGFSKGREHIYGRDIYERVIRELPEYEYIFSNMLNCTYENMPGIYKQCFIALRLTEYDGNANTVQECQAMNIPIVHNQSNYGLKWSCCSDIIHHIKNSYSIYKSTYI